MVNERGNKCQLCNRVIGKSSDLIGHHKVPLTVENIRDAMIALNPDLVDLICFDCHNKVHQRFGYQNHERRVFIVYGPPLSGKTTFVKQNMERGDLIMDMDALYEAVSFLPAYDKPNNLLPIVLGLRTLLIDNVRTRFGKWRDAWIIGGYADKFQRDRLIADLGAEPIFCDISKDECLARLEMDEERQYRKDEWKVYVERWYSTYRE